MRNLNQVNIIGRLGSDPELKQTSNGKGYLQFNIANNRDFGETKRVNWFPCTAFDPVASLIAKYLKKGSKALFSGELQENRWEKDGQNFSRVVFLVSNIEFLDSASSGGSSKETFTPTAQTYVDDDFESYSEYNPEDEF